MNHSCSESRLVSGSVDSPTAQPQARLPSHIDSLRRSTMLLLFTLAFVCGNLWLQQQDHLPSLLSVCVAGALLFIPVSILTVKNKKSGSLSPLKLIAILVALGFYAGFARAWVQGSTYLAHSAAADLIAQDAVISACISSIPKTEGSMSRFIVRPIQEQGEVHLNYLRRIRVSANVYDQNMPRFTAGSCWSFSLRLKTTRGLRNNHGFDYELWLYQQKVGATAYLRGVPQRLDEQAFPWLRVRSQLAETIKSILPQDSRITPLILGLTLGLRDGLETEQWEVLQKTGTSHLLAISGLHVSVAALFGFYLGKLIWLLMAVITRSGKISRLFSPLQYGLITGMVFAIGYAALAGFSVPTQRACAMLSVAALVLASQRRIKVGSVLCIALLLVLGIDPIASLSSGTWLSFIAVAVLLMLASRDRSAQNLPQKYTQKARLKFQKAAKLQLILVMLLSVPVALSFSQVSFISPFVNIILIPLFSFTVVPVLLFGVVLIPILPDLAAVILLIEHQWLDVIWQALQWSARIHFSNQEMYITNWQSVLLALFVLLLLLPKGAVPRSYASILILPLLFGFTRTMDSSTALSMQVYDVGQGLSVLLKTKDHQLLYDTGPAFRSGSSAAERVLLPALNAQNIRHLSALVISHSDNDHAGGRRVIANTLLPEVIYAPENDTVENASDCTAGSSWNWDGVYFEFLSPFENTLSKNKNNNSCVLKVSVGDRSILLTGDIEKQAEYALLHQYQELSVDIVFAPHHGSRTSSTSEFVRAVAPEHVIFPAGFANRWRFPKEDVVQRWKKGGAQIHNIARTGQLGFWLKHNGEILDRAWFEEKCRYWHQDCRNKQGLLD